MTDSHEDNLLELEPLPEGVESPPPYVHTMAIIRWIILGALCLFAFGMILGSFGLLPWSQAQATATQYHCPMHPTYISNQPGECPICGMNLVPIGKGADSTAVSAPQKQPATQAAQAGDTNSVKKPKPGQYYCPMDPQIISDTAGRCPICGMKLQKYEGTAETTKAAPTTMSPSDMANMGSSPVPGLVPVTIEPQRLQLIGVRTGRVERKPLGNAISAVGYVTADETKVRNINVRVSGWVKQLFIDQTGQHVSAGQPLLTIYSQDLYQAEQDFLTALESAGHSAIDQDLTRMRNQLVDAARQRLHLLGLSDREIAGLEKDRKAPAEFTLASPYAGVVMAKNVNAGQYVTPDQNLLTLADLGSVWVLADLYENDLASVHVGQNAEVTITGEHSAALSGKVAFVYPTVANDTRTGKVRIELANAESLLKPGMYAQVRFAGDTPPVLTVPADAIMDGGKTKYAFVVHDRTHFEPRLITVGRTADEMVEVLSGLTEGEEIVTSANFLIDSESRLKAAISGMGSSDAGHTH
jgi:membrane fusion protein, copper/silver efflux system